ncbi:MAG: hypothetical protein ACTSX7_18925 [Alphaproteobacteria bacterium]
MYRKSACLKGRAPQVRSLPAEPKLTDLWDMPEGNYKQIAVFGSTLAFW